MEDYKSPEKGCDWYFAPGVNFSVGPTDAAGQNFDGSWASLVRECIQNSLDAVRDSSKPVVVKFEFKHLPMRSYKKFFHLKDHIQACLEAFPTAQRQYGPMLDFFRYINNSGKSEMGYLQISDSNTRGMSYDKDNDSCNFSAFVRGLGVHGGDLTAAGRGGSFGLGKSTIYRMSPFKTIFVSTFTEENQFVFEGVASLTTHTMNGEKLSHIGYYDNRGGFPITEEEDIPSRFLRKEDSDGNILSGTDIYVMGREESSGDISEIIKSVLIHYWLSIYKGKLVIEVVDSLQNSLTLARENLDDQMLRFFPSTVDNARNTLNPRPYYNAVVNVDTNPKSTCITKCLPLIGNVELYLSRNREAQSDRIACFRLPCMMVMRKSSRQLSLGINSYGVYGVFVCVDKNGDTLLKNLENPAHDDWHEKHWRNPITNIIEKKANDVMDELRTFLAEEIEEFCMVKGRESLKMLGAGKYLYTVQDLVENQEDDDVMSPDNGILAGSDYVDDETGVRGAEVDDEVETDTPTPPIGLRPGNVINTKGQATPSKKTEKPGGITVMVTPPSKKKNKTRRKNHGGTKKLPGESSDQPASTLVPVDFKIYANVEKGRIVHHVCIITEEDVETALIHFTSNREDGKEDKELEIIDSYGAGSIEHMELHNVSLVKGNNMLRVCFNDNTKHAFLITVKHQ